MRYPTHSNLHRCLPLIEGRKYLYGNKSSEKTEVTITNVELHTIVDKLGIKKQVVKSVTLDPQPEGKVRLKNLNFHPSFAKGNHGERVQFDLPPAGWDQEFSHPSEWHFAHMLKGFGIKYSVEPHTFTLTKGIGKIPRKGFKPDFYLPSLNMYVELTVGARSCKSRKMRGMAATFPKVRVVSITRNEIEALLAIPTREQLFDYLEGELEIEMNRREQIYTLAV